MEAAFAKHLVESSSQQLSLQEAAVSAVVKQYDDFFL
jgi:hypothetical protein